MLSGLYLGCVFDRENHNLFYFIGNSDGFPMKQKGCALARMVDVSLQPCSARKVFKPLMIEGMGELMWACPLCSLERHMSMENKVIESITKLEKAHCLNDDEWSLLIDGRYDRQVLFERANQICEQYYGNKVYIRGLIEFSNYCRNDCLYCGIRKGNVLADRYHLTKEQILSCANEGYGLGFRTFVIQGGEDLSYSTGDIADIVRAIKASHPDCAVTLSLGEREMSDYKIWKEAGADRYLLRHETADEAHYQKLHPDDMSLTHRKQCLFDLKALGYQVGCGFMVESPYQKTEHLIQDMQFINELQPHMVGIGPFIPHKDTPFAKEKQGSLERTLTMVALTRIMLGNALIPATTALGTIDPRGREKGLLAGANVVMPNLSPVHVREAYSLYDHKICTGEEAAECIVCLSNRVKSVGKEIVIDRGDYKPVDENNR